MMKTDRRDFLCKAASVGVGVIAQPLARVARSNSREPLFHTGQSEYAEIPVASATPFDPATIRAQFPVLAQEVNGHDLVFLDSAATVQRPLAVIQAISNYYLKDNANPSTTTHTLARRSAEIYAEARRTVARFVNARAPEEIVWTHGTTEAINLAAASWGGANIHAGDEIILTIAEHYSNLVPWQLLAQRTGARLRFVDVTDDGHLKLDHLKSLLSRRTKLVAFTHVSNVTGLIFPVREICELAHGAGALAFVDAAQSAPHLPINVQELGCDFFAFSGHKIMGPMGTGMLWARRELLDAMPPYQSGSIMVHSVDVNSVPTRFAEAGLKFSAGTPNVAGAVGLAAAIKFLDSLGREEQRKHDQQLTAHSLNRLREVKGLKILGTTTPDERISVFSFAMENHRASDVLSALDAEGIAVRGGDLAALPLLKRFGVEEAVRASLYVYTTVEEVDLLADALQRISRAS
ncbi:MAG TPA: SufS family cysteine desulfurase [Candidatus Acidoferrales bacterium]|nr:SufS family cysteine desulfurase [Candidatus Acidoferrales bacterium]